MNTAITGIRAAVAVAIHVSNPLVLMDIIILRYFEVEKQPTDPAPARRRHYYIETVH
jgi:hypothetical protein